MLAGQTSLPAWWDNHGQVLFGTFCFLVLFVTFFYFLVPGRVDRVGGEELEISVHLNRVLCPTIIKWPSWRIEIASTNSQVYLCN